MRRLQPALALFVATMLGLAIWAFWVEPASLTVREYDLHLPLWPPELAGLRVAALSDFHVGSPYNGIDKLQQIVALTNRSNPDLVVLLGDFVVHGIVGGTRIPPRANRSGVVELRGASGGVGGARQPRLVVQLRRCSKASKRARDQSPRGSARSKSRPPGRTFWLAGIGDAWAGNPRHSSSPEVSAG